MVILNVVTSGYIHASSPPNPPGKSPNPSSTLKFNNFVIKMGALRHNERFMPTILVLRIHQLRYTHFTFSYLVLFLWLLF